MISLNLAVTLRERRTYRVHAFHVSSEVQTLCGCSHVHVYRLHCFKLLSTIVHIALCLYTLRLFSPPLSSSSVIQSLHPPGTSIVGCRITQVLKPSSVEDRNGSVATTVAMGQRTDARALFGFLDLLGYHSR